jgi:hypothetical protein
MKRENKKKPNPLYSRRKIVIAPVLCGLSKKFLAKKANSVSNSKWRKKSSGHMTKYFC